MVRSLPLQMLFVTVLFCGTVFAQAPVAQLPDAPQPQPEAKPPQPPPPPEEQQDQRKEKKPESKVKSTLKRGAPNCIHIGGIEKCKAPSTEGEEQGEPQAGPQQPQVPNSQRLPRSSDPNESSSKDSQLPPMPGSTAGDPPADVQEFHAYNPHRADKSVEVGDFYFKRGNYRAAESRYAEALLYMSNHALASYKLGEVQEKLGKTAEARSNYQKYLKILPKGELAEEARKALARLDAQAKQTPPTSPPVQKRP